MKTAHQYLRELGRPPVRYRFDIVEAVFAEGRCIDLRYHRNAFTEDEIRHMIDDNRDYLLEMRAGEEFEKQKQAAEKLIDEIDRLFPKVEEIIAGSDFGQDAVRKAKTVLERARTAIESRDAQAVTDSMEALTRTLNMFRGVVSKAKV